MPRFIVIVVIVVTLIVVAAEIWPPVRPAATPTTHAQGLLSNTESTLFYVSHPASRFAIYLPGEWTSSSGGSSNAATKSWNTDVTLKSKGKSDVTLRGESATPMQVTIGGVAFDLNAGAFFRMNANGKIEQLPFAPLASSEQSYLTQLNEFFSRQDSVR